MTASARILIIFVHPVRQKSRLNVKLAAAHSNWEPKPCINSGYPLIRPVDRRKSFGNTKRDHSPSLPKWKRIIPSISVAPVNTSVTSTASYAPILKSSPIIMMMPAGSLHLQTTTTELDQVYSANAFKSLIPLRLTSAYSKSPSVQTAAAESLIERK